MAEVQRLIVDGQWDGSAPQKPGHLRFVCISDTHDSVEKGTQQLQVPDGDVLIHAGDFTTTGLMEQVQQFDDYLSTLPHPVKIVVAGNHDITFHSSFYKEHYRRFHHRFEEGDPRALLKSCTYLEDSGTDVGGIKVWGSPWQPEFCGWAFNLPRGHALRRKWDEIPPDTDILITHGPAAGHGDLCRSGERAGCRNLLGRIKYIKPRYLICGHIHEDYGITSNGETCFINASTCNLDYEPIHKPIVFDMPISDTCTDLAGSFS